MHAYWTMFILQAVVSNFGKGKISKKSDKVDDHPDLKDLGSAK